jgi:UDP-N-acetyl-D-galactosamine dehydrogenase
VEVVDAYASSEEVIHEYGFGLTDKPTGGYHAVIVAVNHREYLQLDEAYFKSITVDSPLFVDVKGVFRGKIKGMEYWSL